MARKVPNISVKPNGSKKRSFPSPRSDRTAGTSGRNPEPRDSCSIRDFQNCPEDVRVGSFVDFCFATCRFFPILEGHIFLLEKSEQRARLQQGFRLMKTRAILLLLLLLPILVVATVSAQTGGTPATSAPGTGYTLLEGSYFVDDC